MLDGQGEVELWRTVIRQALSDIVSKENLYYRRTARRWFRTPPPFFFVVCDLADVDAEKVRKRAFELMKKKK